MIKFFFSELLDVLFSHLIELFSSWKLKDILVYTVHSLRTVNRKWNEMNVIKQLRFPVHQPCICFCFFRELFDTCLVFSSAILTTAHNVSCYLSHLLFSHIQQLLHKVSSVFSIPTQCGFLPLSSPLLSSWGGLEERADRRMEDGEREWRRSTTITTGLQTPWRQRTREIMGRKG